MIHQADSSLPLDSQNKGGLGNFTSPRFGLSLRSLRTFASVSTTAIGLLNDELLVGEFCAMLMARDWSHLRLRYVIKPHSPCVNAAEDSLVTKFGGTLYEV